ncbi:MULTISPECIES: HlyD family efflux transporter periplasmic adaptor subunit [Enterobacterales]|jgi:adhesin transport system membrane fusion protein|uniref:HlyD family efflux transporter periplasmic adaptor subunit n=1 Tax=Enterobacterales TaxID=91347 RepID=UPI0012B63B70|nr:MULTISPECIES: HlyD family efflux transporter periplasmic adaptor subunit [Enterobacterales]MTC76493.1 HlyD family efflux transporter periplasmic adaptor subunit [Providencia sp. wls1919]EEW1532233.1 HlyD family efflux transporter periplasmic adaptor subunit [Escherichia coli]MCA8711712.1 HlyD family efflux transporter periplasmic adaptor subunit [Escherichia coli]MCA8725234.1 HlyD family efflux transporter periplasmic adaptor subunit [Escherichia coli]MTC72427.1 HlyD family efflux transport
MDQYGKAPKEHRTFSSDFSHDLESVMRKERSNLLFLPIIFLALLLTIFIVWAYNSNLEEIIRGQGTIIPSSREQVIQSIDPGNIQEMYVKEGDIVEKGQILLKLDDARSMALLRESQARVQNLEAISARLQGESRNEVPDFSKITDQELVVRETNAYNAKKTQRDQAIAGLRQSKGLLDREIAITKPLAKEGLVSNVEILRMERQSVELATQINERMNNYLAEANAELVKVESELDQAEETMSMREDPVTRSEIRAPVHGIVKNIKINTIGGVVNTGQDILEIIPLDDKLMVEAYIRPQDVAFLRPGMPVVVKVTAYDYAIYGGLNGVVKLISPDTLSNDNRRSELKLNPDETFYRILVETDTNYLLDKNNHKMEIIPGMVASVDIKTGEKSVFDYLIKPITRMKQAMTER